MLIMFWALGILSVGMHRYLAGRHMVLPACHLLRCHYCQGCLCLIRLILDITCKTRGQYTQHVVQ